MDGTSLPNGCFVAGTLVHTKEGLVPIEKIKVGDSVLSQAETKGERVYKPVVNTFSFEEVLFLVGFYVVDAQWPEGGKVNHVVATGDHPFWVKNVGWTRADRLDQRCELELADGARGSVLCSSRLLATDDPDVAWVEGAHGVRANDGSGNLVYFESDAVRIGTASVALPETVAVGDDGRIDESGFYKRRVFNFEVAEAHTYYVAELGVWVHNANGG